MSDPQIDAGWDAQMAWHGKGRNCRQCGTVSHIHHLDCPVTYLREIETLRDEVEGLRSELAGCRSQPRLVPINEAEMETW